jgi:hypothetical protein
MIISNIFYCFRVTTLRPTLPVKSPESLNLSSLGGMFVFFYVIIPFLFITFIIEKFAPQKSNL